MRSSTTTAATAAAFATPTSPLVHQPYGIPASRSVTRPTSRNSNKSGRNSNPLRPAHARATTFPTMSSTTRPVLVADVLGTLVRDPFFHGMAGYFGFSTFKAFLSAKAPDMWPQFERGALTEAQLAASFFRADAEAGIAAAIDVEALKRFMASSYELLPGVAGLLRATAAAGVETHLCTNYPDWTHLVEEAVGLHRDFGAHWTFVSAREGVRKPERDAYERVARGAGVDVGDCVLLDDREENCSGAVEAGFFAAVRFHSAAQAAEELAEVFAGRGVVLDVSAVGDGGGQR